MLILSSIILLILIFFFSINLVYKSNVKRILTTSDPNKCDQMDSTNINDFIDCYGKKIYEIQRKYYNDEGLCGPIKLNLEPVSLDLLNKDKEYIWINKNLSNFFQYSENITVSKYLINYRV